MTIIYIINEKSNNNNDDNNNERYFMINLWKQFGKYRIGWCNFVQNDNRGLHAYTSFLKWISFFLRIKIKKIIMIKWLKEKLTIEANKINSTA